TMGHKGDGAGLSNDGHECFVLEISYEDFYKLLQEMRDMFMLLRKKSMN
ncbi:9382_t:CDS:1, partial [Entrophospora sp. SA101]